MIKLTILLIIVNKSSPYMDNKLENIDETCENHCVNILKCCENGYAYSFERLICIENKNTFRPAVIEDKSNSVKFKFHFGKPACSGNEHRVVVKEVYGDSTNLGIDQNGNLHIDSNTKTKIEAIDRESFCIDNLLLENDTTSWTVFNAIICISSASLEHHLIHSICMIISCFFILLTVMVYAWLPELNNLHGRVLVAYLICLFTGYFLLATLKMLLYFDRSTKSICFGLTITVYFFLLAAFCWLNVLCFDIWRTFSGRRGVMTTKITGRDNFFTYFKYAFGIPSILTLLLYFIEYYPHLNDPENGWVSTQPCFLTDIKRLIYLYSPILLLWISDVTFFTLTIVKIQQVKRQTTILNTVDSVVHDRQSKERRRLFLYIKLFIVMGINWVLEVVSAYAAQGHTVWLYTDACNALIGFFVFVIFVCKRKTLRLIKKRYAQIVGDTVVRSRASTRTFTTSIQTTRV